MGEITQSIKEWKVEDLNLCMIEDMQMETQSQQSSGKFRKSASQISRTSAWVETTLNPLKHWQGQICQKLSPLEFVNNR